MLSSLINAFYCGLTGLAYDNVHAFAEWVSEQIPLKLNATTHNAHVSQVNPHSTTYNSLEGAKPPNDATVNSSDSFLLDLANATGLLDINKVDGLQDALNSIIGGLEPQGTWDASAGVYPEGQKGWYYICNVAGTVGGVDYQPGDWAVYNYISETFEKLDNTDRISSFNGRIGAIVLTEQDIIDTGFTGGGGDQEELTNFEAGSSVQLTNSLPLIGIVETVFSAVEV